MRKIAIVGTANGQDEAPILDDTWEIWACYWQLARTLDRCTRVYELHDALTRQPACVPALQPETMRENERRRRGYVSPDPVRVEGFGVAEKFFGSPIDGFVLPRVFSFFPDESWADRDSPHRPESLPIAELVERFGSYFTNSVSWMIGHAIHEHLRAPVGSEQWGTESVAEIGVFGVNMATTKEYAHERPSVEYMLGWARGAGIRVTMPEACDLLHCANLYGLDRDTWFEHKLFAEREVAVIEQRQLDRRSDAAEWWAAEDRIRQLSYELRLHFHTRESEPNR